MNKLSFGDCESEKEARFRVDELDINGNYKMRIRTYRTPEVYALEGLIKVLEIKLGNPYQLTLALCDKEGAPWPHGIPEFIDSSGLILDTQSPHERERGYLVGATDWDLAWQGLTGTIKTKVPEPIALH